MRDVQRMPLDRDWQIRLAAFARLSEITGSEGGVVSSAQLDAGFTFEGERIPLWNKQRGIWRPVQLRDPGAALTIVTAPVIKGRKPAYDDEVATDTGEFGYRYQGTDPDAWDNVAVRRALELHRPLIYLYGLTTGVYEAMYPAYVTGDEPGGLTFRVEVDVAVDAAEPDLRWLSVNAPRRQYQTRIAKRRLHQDRFRQLVIGAYRTRCAVCALHHEELLDAAHIIEDHDDRGLPEVPNGLALCKIHHSAYDAQILGIAPDLRVHIRKDILLEKDGPMLQHGLQQMQGRIIGVPRAPELHPRQEFLEERFDRFRAA